MKKLILLLTILPFAIASNSQCVNDFDWGELEYGVSPDPEMDETFVDGFLNMPYEDFIHVLIPTNASVVVEGIDLPIDSAVLESISITSGDVTYTPEEFGISLTCNNDGTSDDPCTFMGGQAGCGTIAGTPLIAGDFSIVIEGTIYVTFFGQVPYPFNYEGYTLFIDDGTSVEEQPQPIADLRVTPNPFTTKALVEFQASQGGKANFKIFTLLGEEKFAESVDLNVGHNKLLISSDNIDAGVYLYHIEFSDFKVTKRLVISK